jgi:DNA polymerase III psi subunit
MVTSECRLESSSCKDPIDSLLVLSANAKYRQALWSQVVSQQKCFAGLALLDVPC